MKEFKIQGSLSRPAAAPAAKVPTIDPHLPQVIEQLEAVIAERTPEIQRLEAEAIAATTEIEQLVAGTTTRVDDLRASRDSLGRSAHVNEQLAVMAERDAEQLAAEKIAKAAAFASDVRRAARDLAAEHRIEAEKLQQEAAAAGARFAAEEKLLQEQRKRLDGVRGPFEEQLAKLRRGRYGEAVKRLPELRERLERRQQEREEAIAAAEAAQKQRAEDEERTKRERAAKEQPVEVKFQIGG